MLFRSMGKAFIDEAVLEIARREDFGFTHYGLISDAILDLMEQGSEQVAADLLEQFRLLFKTAKRFHIDSLEAMMYQVNDGLDAVLTGKGIYRTKIKKRRTDVSKAVSHTQ